jgi:hypothetical protein
MKTKISQLWYQAVKAAMFCSCLASLFSPQRAIASPPPVITVQPLERTVPKNASVTFTVAASSSTALSYQWNYKLGSVNGPILGATGSSYTIDAATVSNAGKYSCSVINAGGTANSRDAQLTVTNNRPVANNDAFTTVQNTPMTNGIAPVTAPTMNSVFGGAPANVSNPASVLDNDSDADGDPLSAVLVNPTANGSLIFYSNGTFNYTPNTNFVGTDSFTYKSTDGTDYSAIVMANITVTADTNASTVNFHLPLADTLDASTILTTAATFNAAINPMGSTASYYFQYGTTTNYGLVTLPANLDAGTNTVNVSTAASGLTLGTTYHFSVVATGPGGLTAGSDLMFTTPTVDTTTLTVHTNGPGGISPALDGQPLVIGQTYTLTATPATGVTFSNWKDANGTVIATNPVLNFLMASNLWFTASFVDLVKPTLSMAPAATANASVSNEQFTVKGNAGDNLSVVNVSYNLNGAGWISANTTNSWTNWFATMTLRQGSNNLLVCALDISGNYSATNSSMITYVPVAMLTVLTNGAGSVSPALNGSLVRLGSTVVLTAAAAPGYAFTSWLNASGAVVTNRPGLTFVMTGNLAFTANFVDVTKPVITMSTPTITTVTTNEFVTAVGKATDNVSVAGVFYQLNTGSWNPATTSNQYADWQTMLDLIPGTNTLSVYAADSAGNMSATNTVRFSYSTAPASLTGMMVVLNVDGSTSYKMAFGQNTFSQHSTETNSFSSVGNYTYTRLTPTTASLKLTYVAPPLATNTAAQAILLGFTTPGVARFTNTALGSTGDAAFSAAATLVAASLTNQRAFYVAANGAASSNVFSATNVISTALTTAVATKWTNYTCTVYSPLAALVKERGTNGTTYIVVNYYGTNYGLAYFENYNSAGVYSTRSLGFWGLASQRAGGNAPTNLVNGTLAVTIPGSSFKISAASNTFAQYSPTAANDTGVGSYTYSRLTTNQAVLKLTYSAPLDIAGATNGANFSFIAPNLAVFPNTDGTFGSVVLGKPLAAAPVTLAGTGISITNGTDASVSSFYFDPSGIFTVSGSVNGSGSYIFGTYSLETGLAQLNFTAGSLAGDKGFLQLDYGSLTSGKYFTSFFDSTNNPLGQSYGIFGAQ